MKNTMQGALRNTGAAVPSPKASGPLSLLLLTALGVVFGDIGTSPLYALNTVVILSGGQPAPAVALGLLSLIIWALTIIISVKYALLVMRADNDGEGGILALMSLLHRKKESRKWILGVGLLGAALIYGDGAITPAISVLSAIEGLELVAPHFDAYVLPVSIGVLILLFLVQPLGTARIGRFFGPIMALWFVVLALLGIHGILQYPAVLQALNPMVALHYLWHGGHHAFLVLGGVFLCVTGAEALYADMGHVGAKPIRLAWYGLVFPSLLLNYAGQTALLLDGADISGGLFYRLCPQGLLIPMIILSTIATIIASQSIITGAFSMTRQAINLGWSPRLHISQTSSSSYGQIYIGFVNWLLMLATLGLTLTFQKSENLAAAYGIAVSLTMFLTTILLFFTMREIWRWPLVVSLAVSGLFLSFDAVFVASNALKLREGGWVPLAIAIVIWGTMEIWHRGSGQMEQRLSRLAIPIGDFLEEIRKENIVRIPGTDVFLTGEKHKIPARLIWKMRNTGSLQSHLVLLIVQTVPFPWVKNNSRLSVKLLAPLLWQVTAHVGFMERPNIPKMLEEAEKMGVEVNHSRVTYYIGNDSILPRPQHRGIPHWQEAIFAFLQRNSARASSYFQLPADNVIELGRQIEI